jgi:tetratricopeptide (TPR) repeat protein
MITASMKYKHFVPVVLIALASLIAYSNTFVVPFQFDDKANIVENQIIKDLGYFLDTEKAKKYTGTNEYPDLKKRYIGHLTFALNYKVGGLDVRGYHITNVVIHILNGIMIYLLTMLIFKTPFMESSHLKNHSGFIALFSALLFVSHPAQTEAVTYIVQRLASLATSFYMLSLICYIRWRLQTTTRSPESRVWKKYILYFLSLASAILAMKTKEIAFTLPLVIMLSEFLFFPGNVRTRLLRLMPLLLTMFIIPLTYVGLYSETDKSFEELMADADLATKAQEMSRIDYLLTQFRVIVTYLRLLVLPFEQNLDYDYPVYDSFFVIPVLLSFLFLLAIFSFGIILFKRLWIKDHSSRFIAFGIFWFFLALSVESSIIPLHVIFEHRLYLPSAGFFTAIVTASFLLIEMPKNQKAKKAAAGAFVLLSIVFISATIARNAVWQSKASLWEDVVSKSPENARGHNNLGNAYVLEGKVEKAIEHYLLALEAKPAIRPTPRYYAEIHYNIANSYKDTGLLDKAIEHYRKSLSTDFNNLDAFNNLGTVYFSKGMTQKAITYYQSALEIDPGYAIAHFNLGEAYYSKGWLDKAIEHYKTFLALRPDYLEAHYNIALAYKEKGLAEKADVHFQRAKSFKKQ